MGFINDKHSSGRKLGGFSRPVPALSAAYRGLLGPAYAGPAIALTLSTTYALLTTECLTSLRQALSLGNESLLIFFQHSQSILWEADLTSRGPTLSLKNVFLWLGTEVGPILTHYIWLGTE